MAVKLPLLTTLDDTGGFEHPLYNVLMKDLGVTVGIASIDDLLAWGFTNALWIFPMATSCCGIELMATAASRVDIDRMGTIVRSTPRQADVMVIAGTITTKMAPRVKKLWDQMPEPKWSLAMGSCAISGDFYRNLYSVVPGVDTFMPVDVYVPGCPPNPESLMGGMLRLKDLVQERRHGAKGRPTDAELMKITAPSVPRLNDPARPAGQGDAQVQAATIATEAQMQPVVEVTPFEEAPNVAPLIATDFEGLLKELGVDLTPESAKLGPPLVPVERHLELATRLKKMGYRQYVSVVASHFLVATGRKGKDPAEVEHCEVTTLVRTIGKDTRLATWSVRLTPEQTIPSLAHLYAGADWQEREQYDLVGVKFANHPDLRRLMMAEDYPDHPLRRDFAVNSPQAPWR